MEKKLLRVRINRDYIHPYIGSVGAWLQLVDTPSNPTGVSFWSATTAFQDRFFNAARLEEVRHLCAYDVVRPPVAISEIRDFAGGDKMLYLHPFDVLALISDQPHGEETGLLRVNGSDNLLCTKGDGIFSYEIICRFGHRGWELDVRPVALGVMHLAGRFIGIDPTPRLKV